MFNGIYGSEVPNGQNAGTFGYGMDAQAGGYGGPEDPYSVSYYQGQGVIIKIKRVRANSK